MVPIKVKKFNGQDTSRTGKSAYFVPGDTCCLEEDIMQCDKFRDHDLSENEPKISKSQRKRKHSEKSAKEIKEQLEMVQPVFGNSNSPQITPICSFNQKPKFYEPQNDKRYVLQFNLETDTLNQFLQDIVTMILVLEKDKTQKDFFFSNILDLITVFMNLKFTSNWDNQKFFLNCSKVLEIVFLNDRTFKKVGDSLVLLEEGSIKSPIKLIFLFFARNNSRNISKTVQTSQGSYELTTLIATKIGMKTRSIYRLSRKNGRKYKEVFRSRTINQNKHKIIGLHTLQTYYEVKCAIYELIDHHFDL